MGSLGILAGGGVDRVAIAHCGYSCIKATVNDAPLVADHETVLASGARLLLTTGENATVEYVGPTYRLKVSSPIADTVWKGGRKTRRTSTWRRSSSPTRPTPTGSSGRRRAT
eukprot:TRINITY_DN7814_c0_g1_i1.p4 TRINITY_DN7814_c0_g1~~TRINITY_DN7814_c0_g1_i1.p4  ORF type:complete len:112 (+),score=31.70 TRINITY_DN7814_c0_g1_i1:266-601(+)